MLVPEFLQADCTPDNLAASVDTLLSDDHARQTQIAGLGEVAAWLGQGQFVPSERAAETVLALTLLN
jgi:lipid-A-disaccharide synthase